MIRTFRAAMTALGLVAIVSGSAQAQGAPVKLGYVNTSVLMASAPGRAAAESLYAKEVTNFQKQQQVWSDSIDKQIAAFQKAEPTMTPTKKQSETERIQKIQQDLSNLNTLGQAKLQQRQNEVLAPLMEMVRNSIEEIRSEGGFAIIFSGDENSPIVAADKNLDLTDRVVARLKTKAATMPAPAPSAMAPAAVKKPPTR